MPLPSNTQSTINGQAMPLSQQSQPPHPGQAQLSGDVRVQVMNILTNTANSCLVEQGYDPSLVKRVQDLELERQKIFEDNKNLKLMLDNERSKNQHLSKPHNELISMVVNSQNEVKALRNENVVLRSESSAVTAKLKALERERENQSGIAYQRLQTAYNDLLATHQNTLVRLSTVEPQLNALAAHCRRCPAYAQQIQTYQAMNGGQLQVVSPIQAPQNPAQHQQPYEQQRRASAPDANLGTRPTQSRVPAIQAPAARMGPPSASQLSHSRSASATQLRVSTSSVPGQNSHLLPVPSPTSFGSQINGQPRSPAASTPTLIPVPASAISSSVPFNSKSTALQQANPQPSQPKTHPNGPHNFNVTIKQVALTHSILPHLQQTPQQAATHHRPSSSLGNALDSNSNAQTQRDPSRGTSQARSLPPSVPHMAPVQQPTPVTASAPPMAALQSHGNKSGTGSSPAELLGSQERPPSAISVASTSRSGSAVSTTIQSVQVWHQSQEASNMLASPTPSPQSQSGSSGLQQPSGKTTVTPATAPVLSSASESRNPTAGDFSEPEVPRPPSNPGSSTENIAENGTNMNIDSIATGTALKRSSIVLEDPSALPEGKRMRIGVGAGTASPSPLPAEPPDASANATEIREEEENSGDEDDEDIAVGPDGLRLVSDCLGSLFETSGAGRTCRLCKTRHARGLIPQAPAPFVNAPDDVLVEHCTAEHEQVWNELRHDV